MKIGLHAEQDIEDIQGKEYWKEIAHTIQRIGIIRALNESAGRPFRAATQHRQNNSDNQSKKEGIEKLQLHNQTSQTRAKRSALAQLVTIETT